MARWKARVEFLLCVIELVAPPNILIPVERQLTALQLCRWEFLYNETLQQTFRPLLSKLTQYRRVTDGQTDGIAVASTALAKRRAVKIGWKCTAHKSGSWDGSPPAGYKCLCPWTPWGTSAVGVSPEAKALLLNKHVIFNAALTKIAINGYIVKFLLHTSHFFLKKS